MHALVNFHGGKEKHYLQQCLLSELLLKESSDSLTGEILMTEQNGGNQNAMSIIADASHKCRKWEDHACTTRKTTWTWMRIRKKRRFERILRLFIILQDFRLYLVENRGFHFSSKSCDHLSKSKDDGQQRQRNDAKNHRL